MANPVYWTMKNGKKIDIMDMDLNHLRNVLRGIITVRENQTKIQALKKLKHQQYPLSPEDSFELKGDMANEFNESCDATEIDIY